jgi:hypothetical protein
MDESQVRSLVLNNRNSPSSIPQLEEYLAAACSGQSPYVFDAVRGLVKLYLLYPSTISSSGGSKLNACCMLAFLHGKSTDLLALRYLIPSTTAECSAVFECAEHLDRCNFAQFWKAYEGLGSGSAEWSTAAALSKLRSKILSILALTYKVADRAFVEQALNLGGGSSSSIMAPGGVVESVNADSVVFVGTPDNTKRERVYQEGVSFATVSTLLHKLAQ